MLNRSNSGGSRNSSTVVVVVVDLVVVLFIVLVIFRDNMVIGLLCSLLHAPTRTCEGLSLQSLTGCVPLSLSLFKRWPWLQSRRRPAGSEPCSLGSSWFFSLWSSQASELPVSIAVFIPKWFHCSIWCIWQNKPRILYKGLSFIDCNRPIQQKTNTGIAHNNNYGSASFMYQGTSRRLN